MRLKKIEILGFKSFADKIKLEFHYGITGIVGPNGCGKSNIADAFRWVLGEQSAKSMRGGKMMDVIFAGTATRKPLNFAEVTITLGDINGALDVEYDEVAITRRLHRNGESDYFLNRHPVRLKDLQSLFLDSGIGKDAYSIFEQGKIDQIINYSPLERRYIFEEAAGILRFLQRKREALRKLEQSDLNICRVKDIHLEVEKQITVLKEQAEKARVYKENKSRLEELEKGVFVAKWDSLQKRYHDTQKKGADHKNLIDELNVQLEQLKTDLMEAKVALAESEKALRARSEEVYKTRSEKEIKSRERQSNQERLKEAIAKEKRWQQELENMLEKRKLRQIEQEQVQKQQKTLEAELAVHEAAVRALRDKMHSLETEVTKLRDHQQTVQREHLHLLQKENQLESELKQVSVRIEGGEERRGQIEERLEKLAGQREEFARQIKEKQRQVDESSQAIDNQKMVLDELDNSLNGLTEEIEKGQEEFDRVQREITELKARQKVLVRLREDMEGFSDGSKRLLQETNNAKSPLYKKLKGLYEYIVPQSGSEAAIASVMRPYAQTLVVQTGEDFESVLAFARKNKLKDYSLLCLEHLSLEPGVKSKEDFKANLSSLLEHASGNELSRHFLKTVFVAKEPGEGIQIVRKASGSEVWVEDGAFIDRNQVVFYTTQSENNVFLREAELKELEKKLKKSESARTELESRLKNLQQRKAQVYAERMELDKSIRRNEMKLVETNFALQRLNGDLEKVKVEGAHLEKDLESVNATLEKLSASLSDLKLRHAEAKSKAADIMSKSASLHVELEKQSAALKVEQRGVQDKESALHKVADENRKALHSLHVFEVKDLESQQQEKRLEEEIQHNRELQSQITVKGTQYEQVIQDVDKLLIEVTSACSEFEKEVVKRKKTIEVVEGKIHDAQGRLKKQENEVYQSGIQSAQAESACQALENELQERYRLTIPQVRDMGIVLEKSLEQTERQIRALRNEMDTAGGINMTSIEEFEKHTARYQFLNRELDDMNVSKQELIEIIAQLDGESRKLFKETFDQIRANFKKNFAILFNGGEADLQFTETSDVLEAGIEIIAKPPGKQMRSINLMSGGEKCMTAMALLFAIFEVKPSPFCILDEIDAPLDDSNIERFVNVLKQFIDRCQFIIITHNKRTMSIADVLFGVSMEERGVSKILAMEFAKKETPEPAMVSG